MHDHSADATRQRICNKAIQTQLNRNKPVQTPLSQYGNIHLIVAVKLSSRETWEMVMQTQ
jgi:hypothetical protein